MCGRYYIEIEEPEMRDILHAVERNLGNTAQHAAMKAGEIFPTNIVPVQAADLGYTLMKWGFSRYDGKGQVINARSETASEKPMFRTPLLESRCIVPASYYFEWEKVGTKKIKYSFRMPGAGLLYLAGLYRVEQNSEVPVFTILTRDAAPQLIPMVKYGLNAADGGGVEYDRRVKIRIDGAAAGRFLFMIQAIGVVAAGIPVNRRVQVVPAAAGVIFKEIIPWGSRTDHVSYAPPL